MAALDFLAINTLIIVIQLFNYISLPVKIFHILYDAWYQISEPLPLITVIQQKDKNRRNHEYTEHR